jgi:hypothetical protein
MAIEQAQTQDFAKRYGQLVARAWADEAFKRRLLAEPAAALAEQGIPVPPGVEVRAVENTDRVLYLTLPPRPSDELSDEQLDAVAGGDCAGTAGSASTLGTAATPSTVGTFGTISTAGSAG